MASLRAGAARSLRAQLQASAVRQHPHALDAARGRDPLVRDRRFGYAMGIVIGLIGVVGCLRFHDVV